MIIIIMDVYESARKEAAAAIGSIAKLKKEEALDLLEKPPGGIDADIAFPCFTLAKRMKKSPVEIAMDMATRIKSSGSFMNVKAAGPYVNFSMDWEASGRKLLKEISTKKGRYGSSQKRGKVMIEFAHPNTHKAFHIGHVRNITLGESLSRILEFSGHGLARVNYQGDIGPHVAKCLWGLQNLKVKEPEKNKGRWLGEIYTLASSAAARKEVEKEIRQMNKDLYGGKPDLVKLWKKTKKWSLDYFNDIYKDFGVKFDRLYFESEVEGPGIKLAKDMLKKGIAKMSDGAIVMDLERDGLGIWVLLTRDETPLYSIKDFILADLQNREFHPERIIHVVGAEQNLHFRQLFKSLERVNPAVAKKEYHLSYGLVILESGKMKSREGKVILYEELKDKLLKMGKDVTRDKNPKLGKKELEKTAKLVSLGALKYDMIKISPEKTITFDWNRALSFDGDTAPYIQYTHARACSILRKARKKGTPKTLQLHDKEKELLKELAGFPGVVRNSARDLRPHYVANYCYKLAKLFNEFYHELPVLKAEPAEREFRLALTDAVRTVLKSSLGLLGIVAPERM